jgi:hypothetical protein
VRPNDVARRDGRAHVFERQVEGERAAHAHRAAQLDLAAEQIRELAADGETEARAAVLSRGAGVGLLERLEDDLLLFDGDADVGVGDFERDDRSRLTEDRMLGRLTSGRGGDVEAHAAVLGELESVREQVL